LSSNGGGHGIWIVQTFREAEQLRPQLLASQLSHELHGFIAGATVGQAFQTILVASTDFIDGKPGFEP
jgi:hypothetical protein